LMRRLSNSVVELSEVVSMARTWRFGRRMLPTILLICVGCGAQGPTAPDSPDAPSTQPSEPRASAATSGSQGLAAPDNFQDSSIRPSDAPPPQSEAEQASVAAESEIFRDSFADAQGAIRWNRDGARNAEGPVSNRMIYFFHGMPEGGSLVMRIAEDNAARGPDGEPGVLALSWQELPAKLPYSGMTYLGGSDAERRLTLPLLKQAKSVDDLRPFRLAFRFQGVNERRETPFRLSVGCRLEPVLADSYIKRLDLGTLAVSGEWGAFEMNFAEGSNAEEFLRAIAEENPPGFKIIWAQAGPLAAYLPGDTLLIDGILITHTGAQP